MTLKARVVNTEASAVKAIAGTIAKAVCVASFAETGLAMAVRAAILGASVENSVATADKDLVVLEPRVVKIAHAAILAGNAAKVLAALEAAVISAADLAAVVASKVDAHPVKADLVQDLVLPATGIGSPDRLMTKRTISFTGFTR
jgi:hypothetical protein